MLRRVFGIQIGGRVDADLRMHRFLIAIRFGLVLHVSRSRGISSTKLQGRCRLSNW